VRTHPTHLVCLHHWKNGVTLKPGVSVVQCHWKWRRSIDHTTFNWSAIVNIALPTVYELFDVIWCWIGLVSWSWNVGLKSLKIIQTGHIRKLGCSFLFALYSNYGSILHHFRDKARYWSNHNVSYRIVSPPGDCYWGLLQARALHYTLHSECEWTVLLADSGSYSDTATNWLLPQLYFSI